MKRRFRVFLSAFIAVSIIGLAFLVFLNYQLRGGYKVVIDEGGTAGVKIDRIRYSGTREGRIEWELEARSATRYKGEDLTVFDDVRLVFYSKDGTPYTISAEEGRLKEATGEIAVAGDVVVESREDAEEGRKGYRLTTESLSYDPARKIITSDEEVEIRSKGMEVKGVGLLIEVDGGKLRLLKDVRTVLTDALA